MRQVPPELLTEVVALTWPDFVEIDGVVLLASVAGDLDIAVWQQQYPNQPFAIEGLLNHVHLYDLVDGTYGEKDLRRLEDAGRRIAASWQAALALRFPGRRFVVQFGTEPDDYGPTVSFHQSDGCPHCEADV